MQLSLGYPGGLLQMRQIRTWYSKWGIDEKCLNWAERGEMIEDMKVVSRFKPEPSQLKWFRVYLSQPFRVVWYWWKLWSALVKVILNDLDHVDQANQTRLPHNAITFATRTYVGHERLSHNTQITRKKTGEKKTYTLPRLRLNIVDHMCFRWKLHLMVTLRST